MNSSATYRSCITYGSTRLLEACCSAAVPSPWRQAKASSEKSSEARHFVERDHIIHMAGSLLNSCQMTRRERTALMAPPAPSLHPKRLVALMQSAVDRCRLDLSGAVVLTEAASGPYVVTPLLAALAGADKVFALARTTRYGSSEDVASQTCEFVHLLGLRGRVEIVSE